MYEIMLSNNEFEYSYRCSQISAITSQWNELFYSYFCYFFKGGRCMTKYPNSLLFFIINCSTLLHRHWKIASILPLSTSATSIPIDVACSVNSLFGCNREKMYTGRLACNLQPVALAKYKNILRKILQNFERSNFYYYFMLQAKRKFTWIPRLYQTAATSVTLWLNMIFTIPNVD